MWGMWECAAPLCSLPSEDDKKSSVCHLEGGPHRSPPCCLSPDLTLPVSKTEKCLLCVRFLIYGSSYSSPNGWRHFLFYLYILVSCVPPFFVTIILIVILKLTEIEEKWHLSISTQCILLSSQVFYVLGKTSLLYRESNKRRKVCQLYSHRSAVLWTYSLCIQVL